MSLEVQNVKEINKGAVLKSFDLFFPNLKMTIRRCALMEKGNNSWIAFPSEKYEKDGETKYFSYIFWDKDVKAQLESEVKKLLSSSNSEPLPF